MTTTKTDFNDKASVMAFLQTLQKEDRRRHLLEKWKRGLRIVWVISLLPVAAGLIWELWTKTLPALQGNPISIPRLVAGGAVIVVCFLFGYKVLGEG